MMYKFKPIIKNLIWGTESWVLSSVPGFESIVAEGPDAGKSINDVFHGQFPLLIKFIRSEQDLSIQVHPSDDLAAKRHGCKGKTEMWYIIGNEPGAHLLSGLKEQITPEKYVQLVEENKITDVLADYQVNPGDVFFLPAGRIHAIGAGCYLAEIQETSDITYRIYDYNRLGQDGKPRQLHVQESKDAIDYTVLEDYRTNYEAKKNAESPIVSCEHFTTSLLDLSQPVLKKVSDCGEYFAAICTEGSATLRNSLGETLTLSAGETALLLAPDGTIEFVPESGGAKILVTY